MITEKGAIKTEAVFDDSRNHRFLLKRTWNKDKKKVCVIMLNPCHADTIMHDTTSYLVSNNTARLDFGEVSIVNLFSVITSKLDFKNNKPEDLNAQENDTFIKKTANEADVIVLGWGKGVTSNQRILERVDEVMLLLQDCAEKLCVISDGERKNLHPLTPSVRGGWQLVPYASE